MGTRYSAVTISGYNSSAPADDGGVSASNQVTWAKHLTKIGNPIKTAVESIDAQLQTALSTVCRSVMASETLVAGDHWKTVIIAASVATSTVTLSLPDAATMLNGYTVRVSNQSAANQTVSRITASDTIDTVTAAITILPYQSITFVVNSEANGYLSERGMPFAGAVGETNTGTNVGTGVGVFKDKSGVSLRFKSIIVANQVITTGDGLGARGYELTLTENANDITLTFIAYHADSGGGGGGGE